MRNMFCLMALYVLSGCASFSADAGKFEISGYSGDPKGMARTVGAVRVEQYRAETCRLYVAEAMKRGRPVSPTVCDSIQENNGIGYPGAYGYGVSPEASFYGYNSAPSILNGTYMPVDMPTNASAGSDPATQEEIRKIDEKANAALRGVKVIVRKHAEQEESH